MQSHGSALWIDFALFTQLRDFESLAQTLLRKPCYHNVTHCKKIVGVNLTPSAFQCGRHKIRLNTLYDIRQLFWKVWRKWKNLLGSLLSHFRRQSTVGLCLICSPGVHKTVSQVRCRLWKREELQWRHTHLLGHLDKSLVAGVCNYAAINI